MSLPTVDDLKLHNNQTASTDDGELQNHLDAAVSYVEKRKGRLDSPVSVTETHRGVYSDVLILKRMPVVSLVSVSSRVGAVTTPLTFADYELDPDTGLVRRVDGGWFSGSYTVTYTTGITVLDADTQLGLLILAEHFWETQRGTAPTALQLQDPNGDFDAPSGRGYAIPNRARELLGLGETAVIA